MRDCLFSDTSDVTSTQLYMTLMDELHMQSLTAEQLMLLYYDDVTREQKNVSDVRRAVRLSFVRVDRDLVHVHLFETSISRNASLPL